MKVLSRNFGAVLLKRSQNGSDSVPLIKLSSSFRYYKILLSTSSLKTFFTRFTFKKVLQNWIINYFYLIIFFLDQQLRINFARRRLAWKKIIKIGLGSILGITVVGGIILFRIELKE